MTKAKAGEGMKSEVPGKEPTVLALHGNLGRTSDWERLNIPGLRALDLWSFSDLSYENFSEFLIEEASEEKSPPVVAGYSLGGRLALGAMVHSPTTWAGGVILSTNPGLQSQEERQARLESDAQWARLAKWEEWDDFLARWNAQAVLADCPAERGRRALEVRRSEVAMAFQNWSLGLQPDFRDRLGEVDAPVLWICGSRDAKFRKLGEEAVALLPKGDLVVLPGKGHRCLTEAAAEVMRDWLANL
ncbi:MAG: alpha/beta fold hydrolase [Verrucomicrobiota bacterium]